MTVGRKEQCVGSNDSITNDVYHCNLAAIRLIALPKSKMIENAVILYILLECVNY